MEREDLSDRRMNYDEVAPEYNCRYELGVEQARGAALMALAEELRARRALEVGVGTGHWLSLMAQVVPEPVGLDRSAGMLRVAQQGDVDLALLLGDAVRLPFAPRSFDMVYCVDAIHHFGDPGAFIAEAYRVLRPGGALAIVGSDPHGGKDHWYVHDYFPGVHEADLARFPTRPALIRHMRDAGFEQITQRNVEWIDDKKYGREVLNDPFLRRHATSQLTLISDEAYAEGIRRIEAALAEAEAHGETPVFESVLVVEMLSGRKPGESRGRPLT